MKRVQIIAILAVCTIGFVPAGSRASSALGAQCLSITVHFAPPPAGFEPDKATDAQLRCYGFPPRPTNPASLAVWTTAMENAKTFVGPPQFEQIQQPPGPRALTVLGDFPGVFAGYHADTAHNAVNVYDGAWAQWNTPYLPNNQGNNWISPWVGIGGETTSYLLQAGEYLTPSNPPKYQWFWYNFYPNAPAKNLCISGCPQLFGGDTVFVSLVDNLNGTYAFEFENVTRQQYDIFSWAPTHIDGSTGEVVLEQPASTWNPGNINFSGATVNWVYNGASHSGVLGYLNIYRDTKTGVMCPSSAGISGGSFTVIHSSSC